MYIYSATSPVFAGVCRKLGCTGEPYGRRSTYLTGCPPGLTPSHDIEYEGVWETSAATRDELFDHEDEVHNWFVRKRMMRETPGDSEWFRVSQEEVATFVESRPWCIRRVPLSEICPPKKTSRYLRRNYSKNLSFLKRRDARNETLGQLQSPFISAIEVFRTDPSRDAGYAVAPCGSGKTRMTSVGIRGCKTCVVCCPSKQIQLQWYATLIAEGTFSSTEISFVGGAGTTDVDVIRKTMSEPTFCILSTYMSSHLLVDLIDTSVELLVLDEAHHMAGVLAKAETGEGRTRRLLMRAVELNVKRISLTYTPRFIVDAGEVEAKVLSMDDAAIFGGLIAELKIRDLIHAGVLPDYRLWTLRDEAERGAGVLGKAHCLVKAWDATEIVRGVERFILDHLIVFTSTVQEAKDVETFLKVTIRDTLVLRVEEGDKLEQPIAQFTAAPRAILINCFVLNEGVDIPIANAVAILYPKHSRGQITQMILRAGRWYEGKSLFHVLIPTLGEEDLSGFEEVLSALASCDDQIRDEIVLRASEPRDPAVRPIPITMAAGQAPECIVIEEFEADNELIRKCFASVRKNLFPAKESRRIQQLCVEKQIDTSVDYPSLRSTIPELPEDPRPKAVLWYDYLHPTDTERMSPEAFVKTVLDPNGLRVGRMYDAWREGQTTPLPSLQNITDGYFGDKYSNFNVLLNVHGAKVGGRGR